MIKANNSKNIDKSFDEIDKLFKKAKMKNSQRLENAMIKPIHDKYPFAQNGICAMIAPMGSGKSYNYMKYAAQQEVLYDDPFYELIVICSTSAKFDETVATFKPLIKKSKLINVKDSDLLDWLNKYIRRILKYNSINKYIDSKGKDKTEEIDRIFKKHRCSKPDKEKEYIVKKILQYGWNTYPHRCLLILDDFASHPLLRSKESEMSRLLKKLRHFNINVIICVQTTKSIPKDIKRNLTDCILFPGISEDDFKDLMREGPFGSFNAKQLWSHYVKLDNPHAMFKIHIKANRILISLK